MRLHRVDVIKSINTRKYRCWEEVFLRGGTRERNKGGTRGGLEGDSE